MRRGRTRPGGGAKRARNTRGPRGRRARPFGRTAHGGPRSRRSLAAGARDGDASGSRSSRHRDPARGARSARGGPRGRGATARPATGGHPAGTGDGGALHPAPHRGRPGTTRGTARCTRRARPRARGPRPRRAGAPQGASAVRRRRHRAPGGLRPHQPARCGAGRALAGRMAPRGTGTRRVGHRGDSGLARGSAARTARAPPLRPWSPARRRWPSLEGRAARGRARGGLGARAPRRARSPPWRGPAPRQRGGLPGRRDDGGRRREWAAAAARGRAGAALDRAVQELAAAEAAFAAAGDAAEGARHAELEAGAEKGEAERAVIHARRQSEEATAQVERLTRRLAEVDARLGTLHAELQERELERVRADEQLGAQRAGLEGLEAQQEAAREQRVRWQVEAAQVEARLTAARERADRAAAEAGESRQQAATRAEEIARIERDSTSLTAQRAQWQDALQERRLALVELEAAAKEAGAHVGLAEADLAQGEGALDQARKALEALGEEEHRLQLERTEIEGRRRGLVERVETEWRKPLDRLLAEAPEVAGDIEWLRQENDRLRGQIDAVGPVNALAVEEHAEEMKRLEFLMTQRDDLVAARNSLQQAAREIDQTAKTLFLESFGKVRDNFRTVFQTLFGGGE